MTTDQDALDTTWLTDQANAALLAIERLHHAALSAVYGTAGGSVPSDAPRGQL
ncbi:hypothetical protein [Kibdelosporangium phytohabitans]|uniref:hypothetical protein n=1 Tax=Kibdelosporangium phytohabitans TaxID=860235 RepID=UPI0012FB7E30|nr:hypothetical protein [Kibdelosporangium phytohabitans]MBE1461802.1 hypothetical protein [Kibdelosporangium phytohabitans]